MQNQGRSDEHEGVVVAHGKATGEKQRQYVAAGKAVFDTRPEVESQGHEHGIEPKDLRASRVRPNHGVRAKERRGQKAGHRVSRP